MKEIEDIIAAHKNAVAVGKRTALATVVHVEGSSYRRPGARMLVTEDGELTGAISGGCLEGDALRKALLAISQQKNKLVTYDTTDEDDLQFGVQLGCNGIVHILFEPIDPAAEHHPVALLEQASLSGQAAVLVTLFSLAAYDGLQPGTSVAQANGLLNSRLTEPSLMAALLPDVQAALDDRSSFLHQYTFGHQVISALVEWLAPPVSLVIVGAGNDVFPLVQMAQVLGWHITVADGRPSHANRQRFPAVRQVITAKPEEVLPQIVKRAQTAIVLMTHNYNYDKAMLQGLLHQPVGYIGVLGPARKLERMLSELETATGQPIDDAARHTIYGPTGLDIGAETAEEIALSIIAEIKMVLLGKNGQSLRDKQGTIHDPIPARQVPIDTRSEKQSSPVTCAITESFNNPPEA